MVNKDQVLNLFKKHFTMDYTGKVDVDDQGCLTVRSSIIHMRPRQGFSSLPVKFRAVTGSLVVKDNTLTTLEGCPEHVPGYFDCSDNYLKNLLGGPRTVGTGNAGMGGWYSAMFTEQHPLLSLEGLPEEVHGDLILGYSPRTPLLRICLVSKKAVKFSSTQSDAIDNDDSDDVDNHIKYMHPHLSDLEDLFNQPEHQGAGGVLRMASAMNDLDEHWGQGTLTHNISL